MASQELDDAVRRIAELMLANEWVAGSSHLDFAETYGVTVATVRTWAADAARFIRLCSDTPREEIRDELLRSIRRVGNGAERAGDYRSANGSLELACKVHGLLDQKGRPEDVGTDQVPVEQLAAALRALGHEVKLNVRATGADERDTERPEQASEEDKGDE